MRIGVASLVGMLNIFRKRINAKLNSVYEQRLRALQANNSYASVAA